ncbi:secretogranin-3 isoform X1 [Gadus morhua]|uniref:Secretogranin-3 n=1 Tax=Gadus morhua TaxID=8049 RepID=A0A8C4ZA68_GADMO|nr:secretogranin-3 isoform X1 [Gadus morhua]
MGFSFRMASTCHGLFLLVSLMGLSQIAAFPTPADSVDGELDKTVYNRQLTEEKPLQVQIAEADSVKENVQSAEPNPVAFPKDLEQDGDDFAVLKSLAVGQKTADAVRASKAEQHLRDDSDSTKSRRLAVDYDSTKTGMEYPDDPESFRQVDGTPLTAEDIVQKIATKIYEEHDRGVFDRIVSKLLKLGLITESQAETLEYQVAETLQDLITKNAKNNEIEDLEGDYPAAKGELTDQSQATDESIRRSYNVDRQGDDTEAASDKDEEDPEPGDEDEELGGDAAAAAAAGDSWEREEEERGEEGDGNEVRPEDGLQDLQYFPNFYRLLKSLDSDQDAQERETLITIMKTLIDFVKMMVKYGTITPEEGVSYLENLDAMIALQTKNKLGKALGNPDFAALAGQLPDDDDNTKQEAARMMKEYENLKDSTKGEQPPTEISQPGKSETYLEAIRKNIEWLKKHNKEEGNEDYDLSKLKDFMDQQVDDYIDKGIIAKEEGETIKRIYSSL